MRRDLHQYLVSLVEARLSERRKIALHSRERMLVAEREADEASRTLAPRMVRTHKDRRLAGYMLSADAARKALAREERFLAELKTIEVTDD